MWIGEEVIQRVACGIIPASSAYLIDGIIFLVSFRPQKMRVISTPCAFFTLYINRLTSAGTGNILNALSALSSMCVCMPASLKAFVKRLTAWLGFSPAMRFTCSNAPPLVSTRAKHPISIMTGAILSSWSANGWNLPVKDFVPETLEEQLICFADKFYSKTKFLKERRTLEQVVESMAKISPEAVEKVKQWAGMFM